MNAIACRWVVILVGVITAEGTAGGVGVGSGNRCMLTHIQTRDCLNERRTRVEIGVRNAAVPRPKTGIYSELREICEPCLAVCPVALLLGKVAKRLRSTASAPFDSRYAFRKAAWLISSSVLSWIY